MGGSVRPACPPGYKPTRIDDATIVGTIVASRRAMSATTPGRPYQTDGVGIHVTSGSRWKVGQTRAYW